MHLTCPEAKLDEKLILFDLVLILHICSDINGKIFESSAKNSLVGSRNCLVRVQTKDSNELTFFRTFQFQLFFPDFERKKTSSGVKLYFYASRKTYEDRGLIRSSLIPRNVFAIWRSYFVFRLKHFSMVGDTAFNAFREKFNRNFFGTIFVS